MTEYDPAFGPRELFGAASRPYLSSPMPWLAWATLLPAAALLTERAARAGGYAGVLALWSGAILLGGGLEIGFLYRNRRRLGASTLGSWAMTLQGNLSLVAVALSIALVAAEEARLLPGLWLLLLGHSLFTLGGLAFPPQRTAGVVYQVGGAAALLPGLPELLLFAAATALGNLWIAIGVVRLLRRPPSSEGAAEPPA
jgi:hypothetical protein